MRDQPTSTNSVVKCGKNQTDRWPPGCRGDEGPTRAAVVYIVELLPTFHLIEQSRGIHIKILQRHLIGRRRLDHDVVIGVGRESLLGRPVDGKAVASRGPCDVRS